MYQVGDGKINPKVYLCFALVSSVVIKGKLFQGNLNINMG